MTTSTSTTELSTVQKIAELAIDLKATAADLDQVKTLVQKHTDDLAKQKLQAIADELGITVAQLLGVGKDLVPGTGTGTVTVKPENEQKVYLYKGVYYASASDELGALLRADGLVDKRPVPRPLFRKCKVKLSEVPSSVLELLKVVPSVQAPAQDPMDLLGTEREQQQTIVSLNAKS